MESRVRTYYNTSTPFQNIDVFGGGNAITVLVSAQLPDLFRAAVVTIGSYPSSSLGLYAFSTGQMFIGEITAANTYKAIGLAQANYTTSLHHFAFTYNKSTKAFTFYVDGVSKGQFQAPSVSPGVGIQFGGIYPITGSVDLNNSSFVPGNGAVIEDFQVYKGILSQSEIQTKMNELKTPPTPTATVSGSGTINWDSISWSPSKPTATTGANLIVSGDVTILVPDNIAYKSLNITKASGAASANVTFVKPQSVLDNLPANGEVAVLPAKPTVGAGAAYTLGIQDTDGSVAKKYEVTPNANGTSVTVIEKTAIATVSGEVNWSNIGWSTGTSTAGSAVVKVSGDTTITVDASVSLDDIAFEADAGATVTIKVADGASFDSGVITVSQPVALDMTLGENASFGGLAGDGEVTLTGNGETATTLANSPDFTGNLTLAGGAFKLDADATEALGKNDPARTVTLNACATLDLNGVKGIETAFTLMPDGMSTVTFNGAIADADGSKTLGVNLSKIDFETFTGTAIPLFKVSDAANLPAPMNFTGLDQLPEGWKVCQTTDANGNVNGYELVKIVTATVPKTETGTVNWSDLTWTPEGELTADSVLNLVVSGDTTIIVEELPVYGTPNIKTADGVESANVTFLKSSDVIDTLTKEGGESTEVQVLPVAPTYGENISVKLDIEDNERGTLGTYDLTEKDGTTVVATKQEKGVAVTGEGPFNLSDLWGEAGAPNEDTAVRLVLSDDVTIVVDDPAKYGLLVIDVAADAVNKTPNATFVASKDVIASLPTAPNAASDEIEVLPAKPTLTGGATYTLGIEDDEKGTVGNLYTVATTEDGLKVVATSRGMGISLKTGLRTGYSLTAESMGVFDVLTKNWNVMKPFESDFQGTGAGVQVLSSLKDSRGTETSLTAYIRGVVAWYGKGTQSANGNTQLTKTYLDDYNDTSAWTVGGKTLVAPPAGRGWQMRLENIPYTEFDLYLIVASDCVTLPSPNYNATPFALKAEGGDWVYFKPGADGTAEKCTSTDSWVAHGYATGDLVEGKNYLKIRVTPSLLGVTSLSAIQTLEVSHGKQVIVTGNIAQHVRGNLAGIQICPVTDNVVTATVEGPGPVDWSKIAWEPAAPTVDSAVRLELTGDVEIVMDDAAAYGAIYVTTGAGVESANATFLKPSAIIPSLPTVEGEPSDEIEVLKVKPVVSGGALYDLGIEDDGTGTAGKYEVVMTADGTKVVATLKPGLSLADPSEGETIPCDTPEKAAEVAPLVAGNPAAYIKVPPALADAYADGYRAMFEGKADGSLVRLVLKDETVQEVQTEANACLAQIVGAIKSAAIATEEAEVELTTKPGLFHAIIGGDTVYDKNTLVKATMATGETLKITLPKTTAPSQFYRLRIGVTAEE